MLKNKMFKNNHLLRMFSMLALLAFGSGEALIAEEPAPEKEKIHIVDLPADTEVKLWTKTSNKDGMKIVLLHTYSNKTNIDSLALVRQDGTIVEGAQYRSPNLMEEIIWLNDSSFLCVLVGRARFFYEIYTISHLRTGGYALNHFFQGFVHGPCKFMMEEGILKIMLREVTAAEITIPSQGKD